MLRQFIISMALFSLAVLRPAQAQDWPVKPVTIVHPFAVGGIDFVLRSMAKTLTEKFGQTFIVENKTGAGGGVGSSYVAKAAPDGYTILLTAIGTAVLNHLLFKSVPYDTDRDFTPVVLFGEVPQIIVSSPKLGFKKLSDLVDYGRANPGKLSIGHPGAGTMGHLVSVLFLTRTGIKGTPIAYRGAAPIVTDLLGGQIQAGSMVYIPPARNVAILAVLSKQRVPFMSDIPTAREGGFDLVTSTWFGFMAPAGTPPDIVKKLNQAINQWLRSPEGTKTCATAGILALGGTVEQFAQTIKENRAEWGSLIAKENIKIEQN